jgi:hypothetical protein
MNSSELFELEGRWRAQHHLLPHETKSQNVMDTGTLLLQNGSSACCTFEALAGIRVISSCGREEIVGAMRLATPCPPGLGDACFLSTRSSIYFWSNFRARL